jgi:nucleolar GTP-binding protein
MGHIFVDGISYQIADTPGLIYRPDDQRNAIEKLALAMIEKTQAVRTFSPLDVQLSFPHLSLEQAVGFVFDPSGNSGTPLEDQLRLRDELHTRVEDTGDTHAWIDIISKIDVPMPEIHELHAHLPDALLVSSETNQGLVELGAEIRQVLVGEPQK